MAHLQLDLGRQRDVPARVGDHLPLFVEECDEWMYVVFG